SVRPISRHSIRISRHVNPPYVRWVSLLFMRRGRAKPPNPLRNHPYAGSRIPYVESGSLFVAQCGPGRPCGRGQSRVTVGHTKEHSMRASKLPVSSTRTLLERLEDRRLYAASPQVYAQHANVRGET